MAIKAIILAAGKGTRVQPLTYKLPKPMVPILGKPVMEYIVEHLARHGIKEIMVNVSHMGQRIEQYFGDGSKFGVSIGYSFEGHLIHDEVIPDPLGSAGALKKIHEHGGFIDDTTLVLCGDAIIDLDITAAVAEHRRQRAQATVVTKEVPFAQVSNYGIVVRDAQHRVASFQEKPSPEEAKSRFASTGIYIFEPEVLDLIPSGQVFDIGSELFPLLVRENKDFFAQCCDFNWIDIGQISDYWSVMQRVIGGHVPAINMPGTEIRDGIWVGLNVRIDWDNVSITGPAFIGSGARIDSGVQIVGPTWIGHGCHIKANASVVRSILFEYAMVGEDAQIHESIVSGNYCVTKDGKDLFTSAPEPARLWGDARTRLLQQSTAAYTHH